VNKFQREHCPVVFIFGTQDVIFSDDCAEMRAFRPEHPRVISAIFFEE